jgi:DNA-binding phage protein
MQHSQNRENAARTRSGCGLKSYQLGKLLQMRTFELEDVIRLLRSQVEHAGGPTAWAKKTGIDRTTLSRVLHGHRPPTKAILKAL